MNQADDNLKAALATPDQPPEVHKGRKGKNNAYGAIAAKKDKTAKMVVLVFEPQGGAPYTVEVAPEKGKFTIPGTDLSFKIARGSVWIENGTARTCVNADNPITVNIHTLTGSSIMHPIGYNGDINCNLAEQVTRMAKTKPIWARGTTWGILGSAVIMGLLMFWLIKTLSGGLEDLRHAIEGIKFVAEQASNSAGSGSGGSAAQNAAGHQNIAPGGV